MQAIESILKPVDKTFVAYVEPVIKHPIVHLIISWVVFVNITDSFYKLDANIKNVLLNDITKCISVFMALFYTTGKMTASLILTLIFIVLYNVFGLVKETLLDISGNYNTVSGCAGVVVKDLVDTFNGDVEKLKKKMYDIGVPLNLELNDFNAPMIGTYLVNFGIPVSHTCKFN